MSNESSPLLRKEAYSHGVTDYVTSWIYNSGDRRDSGYSNIGNQEVYVSVPPIGPSELPPAYDTLETGGLMINCKVCNCMIDIAGKKNRPVVKCSNCGEATPIKNAPPGKKYVRCPCNCLLICKSNSERIACPRPQCKKIINLSASATTPTTPIVPGMCQVSCAHCHNLFLFNTLNNSLARCPHCRKVSSVGHFARRRGIVFLSMGLVFLLISAIVIGVTAYMATHHQGLYVVLIGLPITSVALMVRGICLITKKVSVIEGPV